MVHPLMRPGKSSRVAKTYPDGGEAEAQMEVVPHPRHEEVPQIIVVSTSPGHSFLKAPATVVDDHVLLILGEETRHLASH